MTLVASIREQASVLYNEPEQRPELVIKGLEKIGAERVVGLKVIEKVAALSTRAGREQSISELQEAASPYMKMERKELIYEGASVIKEKVIVPATEVAMPYVEPLVNKSKEVAAPYIAKSKEVAAPYITKGMETKEAVLKDERVQKAMEDLKAKFSQVRERPAEAVSELRSKAVDLIKYEKVGEYRDYVCSDKFVADTTKLVKEDLPQLAKDAVVKGADGVQAASTVLSAELGAASTIVVDAWKKGRESHSDLRSWEALRGLASVLVAEIQTGLVGRIEENQLDEKYTELVGRLKTVFGLNPKGGEPAEDGYKTADEEEPKEDEVEEPATGAEEADEVESAGSDDAALSKPTSM